MGITINAEDIQDAREKLQLREPRSAIRIRWRSKDQYYSDGHEPGCIIDAAGIAGEEVERAFPSSADALNYLKGILAKHDAFARDQKKARDLAERKRLKDAAKKAKCCK